MYCIVLYCIVLYCIVLYCIVLYCYVMLWCIMLFILCQVAFYFVILSFQRPLLSIMMYSALECVVYDHSVPSEPINWHHTYIPHIRSPIHLLLTDFLHLLFFIHFTLFLNLPKIFLSLLFSFHSPPPPLFSLPSSTSLLTPLLHLSSHSSHTPPPPLLSFTLLLHVPLFTDSL